MVVLAATPAQASTDVTVHSSPCPVCTTDGYGWFKADPIGSTPGDALKACDLRADGYSIKAWLYNRDTGNLIRTVSTAGHTANYCTDWKTGDLPEQTRVWLDVCTMDGTRKIRCDGGEGWS
ncbi:hypothetical protein GCM10023084_07500 [Streptomyces lacrimifluminis]